MFGRPVRSPYAYFYPRPPRGGRRTAFSTNSSSRLFLSTPSARRATIASSCKLLPYFIISIHAVREEGDPALKAAMPAAQKFLSTPSARRATAAGCSASSTTTDFYPRPPRGGRPRYIPTLSVDSVFLSTPSARRATRSGARPQQLRHISIHALREEGDLLRRRRKPRSRDFYPRPPRGGRRRCPCCCCQTGYFYPRPPRGGRR